MLNNLWYIDNEFPMQNVCILLKNIFKSQLTQNKCKNVLKINFKYVYFSNIICPGLHNKNKKNKNSHVC